MKAKIAKLVGLLSVLLVGPAQAACLNGSMDRLVNGTACLPSETEALLHLQGAALMKAIKDADDKSKAPAASGNSITNISIGQVDKLMWNESVGTKVSTNVLTSVNGSNNNVSAGAATEANNTGKTSATQQAPNGDAANADSSSQESSGNSSQSYSLPPIQ